MNSLPLGKRWTVFGGPFTDSVTLPREFVRVCVAEERGHLPHDVLLPIEDFSVPKPGEALEALETVVDYVLRRRKVYVGCMAGRGRTGLFLALLAKAFGHADPVAYVRKHYYAHAVETSGQKDFVTKFQIPKAMIRRIYWARIRGYFW